MADTPERSGGASGVADENLFRQEAVDEYVRGRDRGSLLRISPRWTEWTYRVLLAIFVAGVFYVVLAPVDEFAAGPAIVRMSGHTELTARSSGTVEDVLVVPGEHVTKDQTLVRFYSGAERNEYDRVLAEFELHLVRVLRDPLDEAARDAAAAIRPQLVLAEARLAERTVTAPEAGIVSDVRIRPGQHLAIGDEVLTLVREDQELEVVSLLPGRYRPLLARGKSLRLEVSGYSHAYLDLSISQVGDEVVGPTTVRRYLGADVGDAVPLPPGPVVVVRAALPARTFRSDGRDHEFFPGMQGLAEVSVRRESILVALVPGVRYFLERFTA